jgi:hypothetical protein
MHTIGKIRKRAYESTLTFREAALSAGDSTELSGDIPQ